ncbi:MAG: endonuclease III [Deferribacteraceae bacterium]|jgi:endonuclease-3|nr:endonuclease III [Deferribacteraceae bacterium]
MKFSECPSVAICPNLSKRVENFLAFIEKRYPSPTCALIHKNPYELLCATILSAQCTDKQVNKTTPNLFKQYPSPKALSEADITHIEQIVRSTGFYRNKAKALVNMAKAVIERHGGAIPDTLADLEKLPGVGRKTANVLLGNVFNTHALVVDTHVIRITNKLAFVDTLDPLKAELELMKIIDKERWTNFSHQVIFLGRDLCSARSPRCDICLPELIGGG